MPSTISEHKDFLKFVSENYTGELVISTGYTESSYVDFILDTFKKVKKLYLLQCTSAYPTARENTQIAVIRHYRELSKRFNHIVPGFSSHDIGSICSMMAVAAGAKMIEKHVKFGDVSWAHFDDVAVDLSDDSFSKFIHDVRLAEEIGFKKKIIHSSEHHKYWIKAKISSSIVIIILRLSGRVVMQRTATPLTSVRFRSQPQIMAITNRFFRLHWISYWFKTA